MKRTTRTCTRLLRTSLLLLFVLLVVSCATGGRRDVKIKELLKQSVDLFNSDIRWQDYETAKAFIAKSREDGYWTQVDRLKHDIRLTDYQIRDTDFSEDVRKATVTVHFQYWSLESPVLRSATVTQIWRFNEREKAWKVIDTGFNAIRQNPSGF